MKLMILIFIVSLLLLIIFEAASLYGIENIKSLSFNNTKSLFNTTMTTIPIPSPSIQFNTPTIIQLSERALKAAAYVYISSSKNEQRGWENIVQATGSATLTINRMAKKLDDDHTKLILFETQIEQWKADKSRPIINYEPPDIKYQPPDITIENSPDIYRPLNCTSSNIGSYTYTNCY